MKKITLTILCIAAFTYTGQAQFTLTKTGQDPVAGDIKITKEYDSLGVMSNTGGTNQNWNFSSLVATTFTSSSSFVLPTSVPSSSLFPGTTLVENLGGGDYNFWKSGTTATTQLEFLGTASTVSPISGLLYSNSQINAMWPMAPGSTFTNTFLGTFIGSTGSVSGSQTVTSSGTGSISLPGGKNYSNIIQVKTLSKSVYSTSMASITVTFTDNIVQYQYYHASQKFPLLEITYDFLDDGTGVSPSVTILLNQNITVGIKDENFDARYAIYPNPAKNEFSIELSNLLNESCSIQIMTLQGQVVKSCDFGQATNVKELVTISELNPGIYFVKTNLGQKSSVRKLVVE